MSFATLTGMVEFFASEYHSGWFNRIWSAPWLVFRNSLSFRKLEGVMPVVSFDEWRKFLTKKPNVHILQTAEWGELKAAFGWQPVRIVSGSAGIQILFRKLPLGFSIAYLPKPLPFPDALWPEIEAVCRQKRAVFLKIETDDWENSPTSTQLAMGAGRGMRVSPHNIQPPRTILVPLAGSETDILNRMKQKCRYNVRLAEKKGITIHAWDDLNGFHRLMQVTGGRDGFGVHSREYYKKAYNLFHPTGMAEILVAEFESRPLAALMVFALGKRAYYLYGASTDEERNRMPTYLLQWEALKWARSRGCSEYDLWGVPDVDESMLEAQFETRHDGLWGVYRFKRGFGGQVKRAAQALDKVYLPVLYWAYLKFMAGRE
jgi:peptidoglycan pentaglycine glycine transferase (the first glycine)